MLRNAVLSVACRESCCKILCNLINQKEITFLLCFYLDGRNTMITKEAFWYQCPEKKVGVDSNLAMIDNYLDAAAFIKG